ncbi:hypothetical protein ABW20_dc0106405 [Dactylellina cionopaga]|nr:hypothetical protein ABW20_dc0106405 [Dactylellina cionopaga]
MAKVKVLMSALLIVSLWVLTCIGIPTPVDINGEVALENLELLEGILWTGPVRPGGKNHTFSGTIEHIRYQIHNTPGFDPAIYDSVKPFTSSNDTETLLTRAEYYQIDCARSAKAENGGAILNYLLALKDLKEFPGACSIVGPSCRRFTCNKDASLALCVRRQLKFDIACAEAGRIGEIMMNLFINDYTGKVRGKCTLHDGTSVSAQYYIGDIWWTGDGMWWYINALHQPCLRQPWLTIPSPWSFP